MEDLSNTIHLLLVAGRTALIYLAVLALIRLANKRLLTDLSAFDFILSSS